MFLLFFQAAQAFSQDPEPATAKALAAHDSGTDRQFEEIVKSSDDIKAARDWAVENLNSIDPKRIGIGKTMNDEH